MAESHNSQNSKTYIIDGWLKKQKNEKSLKLFGKMNKRFFTLDVINATFSYSTGEKKQALKTIPLRDIESLEVLAGNEGGLKDWEYQFEVKTRSREFSLFAPNKPELDMWVLAFETLLKFRKNGSFSSEEEKEEAEGEEAIDRLRQKENQLLNKIAEVDLYRKNKGKAPKERKTSGEQVTGDDLDQMELEGDHQENLLEE